MLDARPEAAHMPLAWLTVEPSRSTFDTDVATAFRELAASIGANAVVLSQPLPSGDTGRDLPPAYSWSDESLGSGDEQLQYNPVPEDALLRGLAIVIQAERE